MRKRLAAAIKLQVVPSQTSAAQGSWLHTEDGLLLTSTKMTPTTDLTGITSLSTTTLLSCNLREVGIGVALLLLLRWSAYQPGCRAKLRWMMFCFPTRTASAICTSLTEIACVTAPGVRAPFLAVSGVEPLSNCFLLSLMVGQTVLVEDGDDMKAARNNTTRTTSIRAASTAERAGRDAHARAAMAYVVYYKKRP